MPAMFRYPAVLLFSLVFRAVVPVAAQSGPADAASDEARSAPSSAATVSRN
jgi:hypothetical protein